MDDIVAVRVDLQDGACRYFLTWGRIPGAIDEQQLERLVMAAATRFSLGGEPVSAHVCVSLQEAADEPYFFESFFKMCQRPIPYGPGYKKWAADILERLHAGKELHYLGRREARNSLQD